jgi:hypothetical protein
MAQASLRDSRTPRRVVRIPNRFWIPDMPAEEHRLWETQLKSGHEYYVANTLPELKQRFSRLLPQM